MIVYSTDEQLIAAGASPYQLGTNWCWYDRVDGAYDFSHVSMSAVDAACDGSKRDDPLLVDIEAFDLTTDFDNAVANILRAAMRWRTNQPNRVLGLYNLVPERNYWVPVQAAYYRDAWQSDKWLEQQQAKDEWQLRNTRAAAALLPVFEFVAPSVYEFYTDKPVAWRVYAEANIREAIRIANGRPVYPVLMPSIHPGTKPMDKQQWASHVEFCSLFPGVSGLIIHTSPTYVVDENWRKPLNDILSSTLNT